MDGGIPDFWSENQRHNHSPRTFNQECNHFHHPQSFTTISLVLSSKIEGLHLDCCIWTVFSVWWKIVYTSTPSTKFKFGLRFFSVLEDMKRNSFGLVLLVQGAFLLGVNTMGTPSLEFTNNGRTLRHITTDYLIILMKIKIKSQRQYLRFGLLKAEQAGTWDFFGNFYNFTKKNFPQQWWLF